MSRRWQTLILALALAGCATPYQPNGLRGGYEEIRRSYRSFEVWFYGNSSVSRERTKGFALRRAAELTVASHFAGFVVANDLSEVLSGKRRNGSYYEMTFAHIVIETLTSAELAVRRVDGQTTYDAREILAKDPEAPAPRPPPPGAPRAPPAPHGFAMRGDSSSVAASARPARAPS